jgi:hypothetical protein
MTLKYIETLYFENFLGFFLLLMNICADKMFKIWIIGFSLLTERKSVAIAELSCHEVFCQVILLRCEYKLPDGYGVCDDVKIKWQIMIKVLESSHRFVYSGPENFVWGRRFC